MKRLAQYIAISTVGVVVMIGSPSYASGGGTGGGGASGGGGAATGGGTATKGGLKDVVAAPVVPCVSLPSVTAPVGYYSVWAALWNTYTVRSCASGPESVTVRVTDTNVATGTVDYDVSMPTTLTAGQNQNMVLDNDFAPFSTTYAVTVTVIDSSGAVLSSASVAATTPPA